MQRLLRLAKEASQPARRDQRQAHRDDPGPPRREPRDLRVTAGVRSPSPPGHRLRTPPGGADHCARKGSRSKTKRRFRYIATKREEMPAAPNRLERCFTAAGPNRIWASDITIVKTAEGWLHLAVVLDLFSRKIVGWAMSEAVTQTLALEALQMAFANRRPDEGLVHHSDRAGQADQRSSQRCRVSGNVGDRQRLRQVSSNEALARSAVERSSDGIKIIGGVFAEVGAVRYLH